MMRELPMAAPASSAPMSGDEEQTALGLRHCHQQMNTLAQAIFAASAQAAALGNVLQDRGLITKEELVAQREVEEKRLERLFQQRQVGVQLDDDAGHADKYAIPPDSLPKIDCAARYHLCHAACCALIFPLTIQDLEEGVVRWEYGRPYMIRHGSDDRCVHQDRETYACTVYHNRPATCRTYDCRHDKRIWEDFDKGIINPTLFVTEPDGRVRLRFPKTVSRGEQVADDEMAGEPPDDA